MARGVISDEVDTSRNRKMGARLDAKRNFGGYRVNQDLTRYNYLAKRGPFCCIDGGGVKVMKWTASICILLAALWAVPVRSQQPVDVTIVQLIANREKFDGQLIRVIGFLQIAFEGNVL